nr:hypothetical protein [Tanacetum cinerariifolium]
MYDEEVTWEASMGESRNLVHKEMSGENIKDSIFYEGNRESINKTLSTPFVQPSETMKNRMEEKDSDTKNAKNNDVNTKNSYTKIVNKNAVKLYNKLEILVEKTNDGIKKVKVEYSCRPHVGKFCSVFGHDEKERSKRPKFLEEFVERERQENELKQQKENKVTTLAEQIIIAGAENRPLMLEKSIPQVVSAAKLPILNPNEFDLWKMRIEQYFLMTDYSSWEVILNGDAPIPSRTIEGVVQPVTPTTAEHKLARKNELKARGLESVEARLLVYKQNESVLEENIKLLNFEVQLRDTALATLRQ